LDLGKRFKYRRREVSNPLFNNNPDVRVGIGETRKFMDVAAEALLAFMNAELYSRQDNIIFRPELQIAAPVLIYNGSNQTNEIFYVQSLDHSITIGGEATTSINSNFGRKILDAAPDVSSYISYTKRYYKIRCKCI
jgi:hypothetical protein